MVGALERVRYSTARPSERKAEIRSEAILPSTSTQFSASGNWTNGVRRIPVRVIPPYDHHSGDQLLIRLTYHV